MGSASTWVTSSLPALKASTCVTRPIIIFSRSECGIAKVMNWALARGTVSCASPQCGHMFQTSLRLCRLSVTFSRRIGKTLWLGFENIDHLLDAKRLRQLGVAVEFDELAQGAPAFRVQARSVHAPHRQIISSSA